MKQIGFLVFIGLFVLTMGCSNQKSKSRNETASAPVLKSVQIQGAVGILQAEIQIPALKPNESCPMVILMHGVMSSKEDPLMRSLADSLQNKGIASIRFDFDGHGESEGEFINMTVPKEVEDAHAVFDYCRHLNFVTSISALGHSQGGVVTSLLGGELRDSIKSIVLMAPAAVLADQARQGNTLGSQYDPNNIPEYIDVFNHKIGRAYIASAQKLKIYETAANYSGPVCIIHGKADQIVPYSYSEKYDEVYNNSVLHLLEGETHLFDKNQELAVKIAVDFLEEQLQNKQNKEN